MQDQAASRGSGLRECALCAWLAAALVFTACGHAATGAASSRAGTRAPARFVPPFAYEAYVRGELALAANRPQEAVLQLEMATAAPDEDAYLLSRLAEAQAQAGDRAAAIRTLAEAERVDACQEQLWLTRGKWAEADGNRAGAEAAYQRALACAPESERAQVALYRVLKGTGREAEALALLTHSGRTRSGRGRTVLLLQAIAHEDVAQVRFALDSWLSSAVANRDDLTAALSEVTARNDASLALTFKELTLPALTPSVRARLAELSHDRELLQALLAQHGEQALGGPEQAARYALAAHDFERAELYASLALNREATDAARALHVEALNALGEHEAALAETRAIGDPRLQRRLAREQLARLGITALASELAAESSDAARAQP